jgi:hypothetical protein
MQLDSTFVAARIIGPVFIVGGVSMIANNDSMLAAIGDLLDLAGILALAAAAAMLAGLVVVTLHRRWDNFSAILVSLVGWIALVRGAAALLFPEFARTEIVYIVTHPQIVPIAGCVIALIGVWLSYAGYIAGIFRVEPAPPPTRFGL